MNDFGAKEVITICHCCCNENKGVDPVGDALDGLEGVVGGFIDAILP